MYFAQGAIPFALFIVGESQIPIRFAQGIVRLTNITAYACNIRVSLKVVELCSRYHLEIMLQQYLNGLFRVVEAEDDDGVLPAFLDKGINIFDVDTFFGNNFHDAVQATRFVGNFHGNNRGFTD